MATNGPDGGIDMDGLKELLEGLENDASSASAKFEAASRTFIGSLRDIAAGTLRVYKDINNEIKTLKKTHLGTVNIENVHTDSYVVVLIDGNAFNHQFRYDDIRANCRGGEAVARNLSEEVTQYIRSVPGMQSRRVVVKIYADLKKLSRTALHGKLVDANQQTRALAPFVSAFNSVSPFFDFVDTLNKQVSKIKVSEHFKLCVDDPNCVHIIFGVGLVLAYVDMLKSQDKKEKIVLLRMNQVDSAYEELGFNIIDFKSVFRPTNRSEAGSTSSPPIIPPDRFGNLRRFSDGSTSTKQSQKAVGAQNMNPYNLPTFAPRGLIPINAANERIDIHMRPPTTHQREAYNSTYARKKPCAAYHLEGKCNWANCSFDHGNLKPAESNCLKYIMKGHKCLEGGRCRSLNCIYGHVCQKPECAGGRTKGCKLSDCMHGMDVEVAQWVEADETVAKSESHGSSEPGLRVEEWPASGLPTSVKSEEWIMAKESDSAPKVPTGKLIDLD